MRKIYDVDISILSKPLRKGSINIIDKIETAILLRKNQLELSHNCKITNVSLYNHMPYLKDYESHIDYGDTDRDNYYKRSYNINWDFVNLRINKIVPSIITNVVTIIYINEITLLPVCFDRIGFSNETDDEIYYIDTVNKWDDSTFILTSKMQKNLF